MKYLGQRVKIKACNSIHESWHGLSGVAHIVNNDNKVEGDYEIVFDDGDTLTVKEFEVEPEKKDDDSVRTSRTNARGKQSAKETQN